MEHLYNILYFPFLIKVHLNGNPYTTVQLKPLSSDKSASPSSFPNVNHVVHYNQASLCESNLYVARVRKRPLLLALSALSFCFKNGLVLTNSTLKKIGTDFVPIFLMFSPCLDWSRPLTLRVVCDNSSFLLCCRTCQTLPELFIKAIRAPFWHLSSDHT